jgi:UDP-N-acetylglucosamine acyltransferase
MPRIKSTSYISKKAIIHETVEIGSYCIIEDDVEIGEGSYIGPYTMIQGPTIIGRECRLEGYVSAGGPPQDLKYNGEKTRLEIGDNNVFREFVTLNRGTAGGGGITRIGSSNMLMAYCHVAHDCQLGNNIVMGNLATLAGHVHVEDRVIVGGLSAIHQFTKIGAYCILGGGSMVGMDILPYAKAQGNRAKIFGINTIGLKRNDFSDETITAIGNAYRLIFKRGLQLKDAAAKIEAEFAWIPEVMRIVEFIKGSERGIAR